MKQTATEIATANETTIAKLGLRFDKVVRQLFNDLTTYARKTVPANRTVLVTCTAPVRLSGKTEKAIEEKIEALLARKSKRDLRTTLHGNKIRIRVINSSKRHTRLIGFVHNPSTDGKWLLDVTVKWLLR